MRILCKARNYLSKESLLSLYYAYIHTYVNYANLAWASTVRTNLKRKYTVDKSMSFALSFVKINFHALNNFLYRTKFLMYIN